MITDGFREICEPLKELTELWDSQPVPCTKFQNATRKEWVAKLSEEIGEVIEALYDPEQNNNDLLREMVDVVTVLHSLAYARGFTQAHWNKMQRWVNKNNIERGYTKDK